MYNADDFPPFTYLRFDRLVLHRNDGGNKHIVLRLVKNKETNKTIGDAISHDRAGILLGTGYPPSRTETKLNHCQNIIINQMPAVRCWGEITKMVLINYSYFSTFSQKEC